MNFRRGKSAMTSQIAVVTLHKRHPELLVLRDSLRVALGMPECPSGSLLNFSQPWSLTSNSPDFSSPHLDMASFAATYADTTASKCLIPPDGWSYPGGSQPLFQWVQWIIMRNMPIHEVEDELTRAMSKLQPVTVKAIEKCMEGIAIKIAKKLEVELNELFGLMFDGWSHAGVHYVALLAVYEADGELRLPLIGLSPLVDDTPTPSALRP
ncbi:unnamed protein product [Phytophthora fragariaefolia]|uniref:Unnamed protein product n=1 Tax=Phytophthora fragariaefolia TaxID=1490495 RepID=A0A9W6Y3C9_9STRA|nr:unnamed protein product [Phytophthora fragariaefolia]